EFEPRVSLQILKPSIYAGLFHFCCFLFSELLLSFHAGIDTSAAYFIYPEFPCSLLRTKYSLN
ncbi:hypothetical protein, partial [Vibrio harveyi]|uniref:hypothetical protein n=1 Tax=Vibrio harveyi TaxID=669 RepID=UPI001E36E2C6